jgi:glycerol-3-phosphate acyltransferase PlsY
VSAYVLVSFIAYLIGSFPSGYLAGRMCGVDLRVCGSGNIGATNALRVLGKKWGYAVFVCDALKGALAVMAGFVIGELPRWEGFVVPVHVAVAGAFFVVVGHSFPVWLGFRGGKGIATSAGIMLALFPFAVFLAGLAVWLGLFFSTRFVSVASLGSAVALPTTAFVLMLFGRPGVPVIGQCDPVLVVISALMGGLAIWRHKDNIRRLMAGTEKRFEKKPR